MAKVTRHLGFQKLKDELKKRKRKCSEGFEVGSRMAATQTLRRSNYYVPIDKKNLHKSGKVITSGAGLNFNVSVQYGDNDIAGAYAVRVHEDMDLRHGAIFNAAYADDIRKGLTHARRPQESAKFLSKGLQEARPYALMVIVREVKKRQ